MKSLKSIAAATSNKVIWPQHIITPSELMKGLGQKTKLHLLKSPIYSKIVLQIVGSWAYLVANVFNKSEIINIDTFNRELKRIESQLEPKRERIYAGIKLKKPYKAPLLTLSNHISCIDDPVLWASLLPSLTYYSTKTNSVRWSAAAVEICFSKPWHSTLFSLGKTFPVVRGVGLNQPGMEFAAALLNCNQWLHLFPEGRVMRDDKQQKLSNKERGYVFKWGISKLILDYLKTPSITSERIIRVLPFYHLGLDEILPIGWPYIPRFGKRITVYIRPKVIEMNPRMLSDILRNRSINSLMKSKSDDVIKRIKLTNYLEEEMEKLIGPASAAHEGKQIE